jgi:hypothetical protein
MRRSRNDDWRTVASLLMAVEELAARVRSGLAIDEQVARVKRRIELDINYAQAEIVGRRCERKAA